MFSALRRLLASVLCFVLVPVPALLAQQANPAAAPVPPQLLHAHSVFVANGGGSNYFEIFDGGPNRAYNTFYSQLNKTGQYQLVSSPGAADAIFEIRAIAPAVGDGRSVGYNPQVVLTVRDPRSNAVLWTERANVRVFGTKGRRDREFDQSVAVLVDKLAQVTGQPLTEAQTKAVESNSRMPTAAKVFLVAAIAAGVGMTAYGIYRIENPPSLPPLPQPAAH